MSILEREHGVEGVCVCWCRCCEVLCVTVCSALQRHRMASRAVPGALELCVGREELRGTLPAALPEGSLAAEQGGRTQLWICSRAS